MKENNKRLNFDHIKIIIYLGSPFYKLILLMPTNKFEINKIVFI